MKLLTGILLFVIIYSVTYAKSNVPVLVWAPNRPIGDFPVLSALQQVSYHSFQGNFLNSFTPNKIIYFLQDELSVEDLSNHPDQLKNVATWMQKSQSLYLPSVENPAFLVHDLPAHGYEMETLEPGFPSGGIIIKNNSKTLILVKLPPTTTNPSRKNALQKADEVINSVISKIGGLADFVVLYTGMMSSVKISEDSVHLKSLHRRVKRQSDSNIPGYHFSECVLLYMKRNFIVNITKNDETESVVIPENTYDGSVLGDCGKSDSVMLKMLYRDVEGRSKLNIELTFVRSYRRWKLTGGKLDIREPGASDGDTIFIYPRRPMAPVPLKKSYTCGSNFTLRTNSSDNVQYTLIIPAMQVEAFTYGRQKFSPSWDCVGFFSIPIWAGLITIMLLVPILFFGLYMLLDLKTADKFDDPKGSHFMVNAPSD